MSNQQNSDDEDDTFFSFGKLFTPKSKHNFMATCVSITENVNDDIKTSLKNELVQSAFLKQIEDLAENDIVKNEFKMKRDKCRKRFQAYETTQKKIKKECEEIVDSLQEKFELFDNFINLYQKKDSNQNKTK